MVKIIHKALEGYRYASGEYLPTLSLSPEVEVNELTEVIINAEATDSDGTITSIK